MNKGIGRVFMTAVAALLFSAVALTLPGCGARQVTVISFTGKGSQSAQETRKIVDGLKKKYKDRVIFKYVDMDDPADKGEVKKYSVTMNPTIVVLNTKGEVKETFMGKPAEEMLVSAIESLIPVDRRQVGTTPSSGPPGTIVPPSSGSVPVQSIPAVPAR